MTKSRLQYYFLLASTFVVGGLIGAAISKAVFGDDFKSEAIANLGVAAGTLALAVITFVSVMKTNDVISGEDKRHQLGYAPIIIHNGFKFRHQLDADEVEPYLLRYSSEQIFLRISNVGLGLAKDITVIVSYHFDSGSDSGSVSEEKKTEPMYIPLLNNDRKNALFAVVEIPDDYPAMDATRLEISYFDIFDNEYRSIYEGEQLKHGKFDWKRPEKLSLQA